MKLEGRKPQTYYFKHGWIKFNVRRADQQLYYVSKIYTEDGKQLIEVQRQPVANQEHLNQLLATKHADEILSRNEVL